MAKQQSSLENWIKDGHRGTTVKPRGAVVKSVKIQKLFLILPYFGYSRTFVFLLFYFLPVVVVTVVSIAVETRGAIC